MSGAFDGRQSCGRAGGWSGAWWTLLRRGVRPSPKCRNGRTRISFDHLKRTGRMGRRPSSSESRDRHYSFLLYVRDLVLVASTLRGTSGSLAKKTQVWCDLSNSPPSCYFLCPCYGETCRPRRKSTNRTSTLEGVLPVLLNAPLL